MLLASPVMPLPDLADIKWDGLDWGSLPAWAGALSLFLAFRIFLRDHSNAERAQVDLIGTWGTTQYEIRMPDEDSRLRRGPHTATARLLIKNASALPIEVEHLTCKVETTWLIRTGEHEYDTVDGRKSEELYIPRTTVAPDSTWESPTEDFYYLTDEPPEGALQLSPIQGVRCVVTSPWIIDNAGRRWESRLGKGRRAKRVKYRRPKTTPAGRWWTLGPP
jgi:hypothetical protein